MHLMTQTLEKIHKDIHTVMITHVFIHSNKLDRYWNTHNGEKHTNAPTERKLVMKSILLKCTKFEHTL